MISAQFTSPDDAKLVFLHSKDILAQSAAFTYLEQFLPPDVREELHRKAREITGIDKMTPVGWNAVGDPLYDAAELAQRNNLPLAEVIREGRRLEEHQGLDVTLVKHPTLTPLTNTVRKGQVRKSESVDPQTGEEFYYLDGRATMQLIATYAHEGEPKAIQTFNTYCSLAAQRGCSSQVIDRLRQAVQREGSGPNFLKWLDRASRHLPEAYFIQMAFNCVPDGSVS